MLRAGAGRDYAVWWNATSTARSMAGAKLMVDVKVFREKSDHYDCAQVLGAEQEGLQRYKDCAGEEGGVFSDCALAKNGIAYSNGDALAILA